MIFIIKFLAFFIGCYSCLWLQTHFELSAVASACIVGLAGSFYNSDKKVQADRIKAIIYAGAFAGMTAPEHFNQIEYFLLLSLLGTLAYFASRPFFNGIGGKLGTIAFVASFIFIFLKGKLL
jgi:hypothetical protein